MRPGTGADAPAASVVIVTWLLSCVVPLVSQAQQTPSDHDQVAISNPLHAAADPIDVERIPIGIPDDYTPCLAVLPGNELILIGFHTSGGVPNEYSFLYRSTDSGRSWSKRRPLDIIDRELYLSVTRNGTIFISTHVLTTARGNTEDYVYSNLYRSSDSGRTFTVTKIGHEQVPGSRRNGRWPGRALIVTGRNVVELHDGTLAFGVGAPHGAEFLWRSRDDGRNWDKQLACTFGSIDMTEMTYPILGEAFFHQAPNGDLLALCRVMLKFFPPIPGTTVPRKKTDQWERMVLYRSRDAGATWGLEEVGSWHGEMYPSVLALQGGDMLLTFTVRAAVAARTPHLVLRAVLGKRTHDGFLFDFDRDRIMLETRSAAGVPSGGGFGPTVQLDDGTLVPCYSYRAANNRLHVEIARWTRP